MFKALFRYSSADKLKETAWKAMEEYKEFVFEVDSVNTWLMRVLKAQKPVLFQAYAGWSIPCRKLMPLLEKRALEAQGKWNYARTDIDEVPELASALQITVVPTLFVINKGNSVNRIEGLPTEESINELVEDIGLLAGLESDDQVVQGLIMAGEELMSEKKYDEAIKAFNEAMSIKDLDEKYVKQSLLGLSKSYYYKGDTLKANEYLLRLKDIPSEKPTGYAEFTEKMQQDSAKSQDFLKEKTTLEQKLQNSPENPEIRCELSLLLHKHGLHEEALEHSLSAISLEKSFKGLGQKTTVKILNDIGPSHVLIKPTRKRLQSLYNKYS